MTVYKNETGKPIYLNEDRTALAEEDTPEARFLLVGANGELPEAEAVKYGLMDAPKADPSAPRQASRVEQLQQAHDAAMARGATEEARVHRANLEAAQAEQDHADRADEAAPSRRTAAGASPRSAAPAASTAAGAEGGRTVPRQAKGE